MIKHSGKCQYCSGQCSWVDVNNGVYLECEECGTLNVVIPSEKDNFIYAVAYPQDVAYSYTRPNVSSQCELVELPIIDAVTSIRQLEVIIANCPSFSIELPRNSIMI